MKTDFNGYMPKNYNEHYLGWTDVRAAIMTSSNVVAVKTYNALGFKNVQSFANSVGINISDFDENATVALGNFSKITCCRLSVRTRHLQTWESIISHRL